jgi:hypothetical protein
MPALDTKDWKLTATLDYKCKTEPIYNQIKWRETYRRKKR